MFSSLEELTEGLRHAGYIVDSVTTTAVYLAATLHKPVLLEGPAGSGKTQLAYAVADAASAIVERLQWYQGISEDKAIGKFDESLQQLCVDLKAKSTSVEWDALQLELQGRRFFSAGPLLRALEYKNPCVLLIDELDKVDHAFDALAAMMTYDWPGNVRELENCIEQCCALNSGPTIHVTDLPASITGSRGMRGNISVEGGISPIAELEQRAIVGAIEQLNGDKLKAAKMLGIGKTTLYRKLKQYRPI
jgi:hypothetical protein